jgi:predicted dehydrogenase
MNKKNIWIVGAGVMAKEHAKALLALGQKPLVVGNSIKGVEEFRLQFKTPVVSGGVHSFLATKPQMPEVAIVVLPVEKMAEATLALAEYGVHSLLVEKPFGKNPSEIRKISDQIKKTKSQIYIAYNRRFYDSVQKAKEIIAEDGGLSSVHFEFTEWVHTIKLDKYDPEVLKHLFLGNSTHVVDTVFYLMGKPRSLNAIQTGSLEWHPSGSVFCGSGLSTHGVPFTYHSNWESAGRWGIELLTSKRKLILRPMEILQQVLKGTVSVEKIECEGLDLEFKAGMYRMHNCLLKGDLKDFCSLEELLLFLPAYQEIGNYPK